MSVIPELIIQRVLVNGIRELRNNSWKSDQLFKNVPQDFAQKFQQLITNTSIDITVNYPREDSQFPCIAILLRGEEETNILLGDMLGAGFTEDNALFQNSEQFFFASDTASDSSSLTEDDLIGEPRRIFDSAENKYREKRGSGFSSSYMLQIMTDNQDFTLFLYHAARYIILSNMRIFERNGIFEMRMSGTDFLPQPAYQPSFVFMRGLTLSFVYFAEHFVMLSDEQPVASSFVIDLELPSQLGTDSPEGVLAALSPPNITAISVSSGTPGSTISNIITGINFQTGFSLSIFDPITLYASDIILSELKLLDDIKISVLFLDNAGQENSTKLKYVATSTESIPSNILEGMVLKVTGPITHGAYNEHRRIVSFTSGAGGSITVANEFSSSLSGAFIEVFKKQNQVSFEMAIASDAVLGFRDVKLTNPDSKSDTLKSAFNVSS